MNNTKFLFSNLPVYVAETTEDVNIMCPMKRKKHVGIPYEDRYHFFNQSTAVSEIPCGNKKDWWEDIKEFETE